MDSRKAKPFIPQPAESSGKTRRERVKRYCANVAPLWHITQEGSV